MTPPCKSQFCHKMKFLIVLCFSLSACVSAHPSRIIGGQPTTIEARPYQAALLYWQSGIYELVCGASILSSKFLLTAAHCYPIFGDEDISYARVGSTIYNSGGQILKVDKFTPHPLFDMYAIDYDFAIISFAAGVEFTLGPTVQVVKLTNGEDPAVGSFATVSGWGYLTENVYAVPEILHEVSLPVWDDDRCRTVYPFLTPRHICLGGTPEGGTGSCRGDSGGPAVQGNGSSVVQYALVSGGNSCSLPNDPIIFARISSVRPWITEMTGV